MHRVGQFVSHVRARVDPEDERRAAAHLPPRARALFRGMPVADRRHALDVVDRLVAGGNRDPDLLAAALRHDAAKGGRMRLWHRVAGVLLERLAPALLRRVASPDPRSAQHPFWLYLHHGPMSADLAAGAGCTPRTVRLIQGAASDPGEAELVALLRYADDAS